MTTYSRTDLAERVLKDLGLVASEATLDAADSVWAEETIASVTAQLAVEGIVIWNGSDQALPLEYLVPLSKRIGLEIAPSFGLMGHVEAETLKPALNTLLRRMNAKPSTGAVAQAEYF